MAPNLSPVLVVVWLWMSLLVLPVAAAAAAARPALGLNAALPEAANVLCLLVGKVEPALQPLVPLLEG